MIRLLRTADVSPDGVVAALARPHAATDPDAVARVAAIRSRHEQATGQYRAAQSSALP